VKGERRDLEGDDAAVVAEDEAVAWKERAEDGVATWKQRMKERREVAEVGDKGRFYKARVRSGWAGRFDGSAGPIRLYREPKFKPTTKGFFIKYIKYI
jgi:hypothetical protein